MSEAIYQIVSEDITKFHIEGKKTAIINSLGAGKERIRYPGALYHSIISAAQHCDVLIDEVNQKGQELPEGSVFSTGSYGLPCDGILHAITPFAYHDTESYKYLFETYHKLFHLALDEKYQAILVPLIGVGANGYQAEKVLSMVSQYAMNFVNKYHIDVYLDVYNIEHSTDDELCEEENCYYEHRLEIGKAVLLEESEYHNEAEHNGVVLQDFNAVEDSSGKVELQDLNIREGESFSDLIDDYINQNYKPSGRKTQASVRKEKWRSIFSTLGKGTADYYKAKMENNPSWISDAETLFANNRIRYRWRNNNGHKTNTLTDQDWLAPTKAELILVGCSLDMTSEDVEFLMMFCGYGLSPYNCEDKVLKECMDVLDGYSEDKLTRIIRLYSERMKRSMFPRSGCDFEE